MKSSCPGIVPADGKATLHQEAQYLHHCVFRRNPSDAFVDAYVRAHAHISDLCNSDEQQLRTVSQIVTRRLDAVGIEPWLRRKGRRHVLSAKLLLIAYLSECDGTHPEFAHRYATKRMALARMGGIALAATFRLLRGYVLKVRRGLL